MLRSRQPLGTRVRVGDVEFGGPGFVVIAGPCAVEGQEQTDTTAVEVARAGAHILRGGAFKPRTSPYSFQGMGEMGLRLLSDAGRRHGMPVVSEVMDASQIDLMYDHVDILQVGTRNMHNYALLRALAKVDKPVLLKRGMAATVHEWLLAAEYLLEGGNPRVILCERGIRTFEPEMRNTLDLSAVALVKQRTHLPVVVDPSHATGLESLVVPMSLAAAAAGADGLLVDVHPWPEQALCDGHQALLPETFAQLMQKLEPVLHAVDRMLWRPQVAASAVGVR
ncbi:MAG: 3-deoxy-7-phosphoheptulonate synthase [Myxococcaceae bacterium]|nr:3-deoxy-7-phosphoheptulonate synthase [Myxococcaceae bacterium]